jgi:hypothetical protein
MPQNSLSSLTFRRKKTQQQQQQQQQHSETKLSNAIPSDASGHKKVSKNHPCRNSTLYVARIQRRQQKMRKDGMNRGTKT